MALAASAALSLLSPKRSPCLIKLHISISTPCLSLHSPFCHIPHLNLSKIPNRFLRFQQFSATQEIAVEEKPLEEIQDDKRRKLYVFNIPWNFPAPDIRNLFSACGTVKDIEIIKLKDGRNRGFAFITMASGEEARAAVEKFNSFELQGRIIRVEFAKSMKKPSPPPPEGSTGGETRHKIYISNLAWKARSSNLREFFAASCNPVSARVVFESPSGRSAGYGFVSFATKEEAEAAISTLDGRELMGRPIRLKMSEKNVDESGSESNEEDSSEGQIEESSV
ncbi:30 kDa ribonucleoprotein, chloroplastic-like [Magnolia sinica]|uniref:30 kDa ribonucleoprotein, chloroplastic-like n=1 Tax=Magnolia sinica TaxID=86752 RepID=UPI0026595EAF|nr:30 kDa ribonucleoprotein, chloroplastic-like [Magnolia sinica]